MDIEKNKLKLPIYMDNQATTPMDPLALQEMLPYFTEKFGNPHSRSHKHGWEAEAAVEKARKEVADLAGCSPKEIIFTSGATESNNLAIKGIMGFYGDKKNHLITTVTEHKCLLEACRSVHSDGFEVTYLPVDKDGLINLKDLENAITDKTALVSIMMANNEIGTIQPVKEIGEICRKNKVFFHTDGAQAFGKIPVNVDDLNIDLMSISGHKIYGPKGIGAIYIRRRPRVRLKAIISGGGQERGFRSGTLPVPLIVGFGKASSIALERMEEDGKRISALVDRMYNNITSRISGVYLNGPEKNRVTGNINLSFSCVEGESMIMAIRDISVSSGSACTSSSLEPSYVLRSIGVSEDLAHTSIRFGLGRFTTVEEVDYAVDVICKAVKKLRDMSPLWDMVQQGIDINSIQWSSH